MSECLDVAQLDAIEIQLLERGQACEAVQALELREAGNIEGAQQGQMQRGQSPEGVAGAIEREVSQGWKAIHDVEIRDLRASPESKGFERAEVPDGVEAFE